MWFLIVITLLICFCCHWLRSGCLLFLCDNKSLFLDFLIVFAQLKGAILEVLLVSLERLEQLICLQSAHQHSHLIELENFTDSNVPLFIFGSDLLQVVVSPVVPIAEIEVNLARGLIC